MLLTCSVTSHLWQSWRRMADATLCMGPDSAPPKLFVSSSGRFTPDEASGPGEDGSDPNSMGFSEVRAQGSGLGTWWGNNTGSLTARLGRGKSQRFSEWGGQSPSLISGLPPGAGAASHPCYSLPRPPCRRESLPVPRSPSTCSPKGPSGVTQLVSSLCPRWGLRVGSDGLEVEGKNPTLLGSGPSHSLNFPTCKMGVMSGTPLDLK